MTNRRRGMILVLVLASLALAAAFIAPLATLSGVESLAAARRSADPRHRLAAESLVALLPQLLAHSPSLEADLDRGNEARLSFDIADIRVDVLIQDDTAKFPAGLLPDSRDPYCWDRAHATLHTALALPTMPPRQRVPGENAPLATGCLDDLFDLPADVRLFGTPTTASVWSSYVTPLGRQVNFLRADRAVLEAAFADLQPGLGTRLADARRTRDEPDVAKILAELELDPATQRVVMERLTTQPERYSLLIRTTIAADARQRYLICSAADPPEVIANWEVAP